MADIVRAAIAAKSLPIRVMGPAPAPVTRLKGSYRFHFQLSAVMYEHIQDLWRLVRDQLKPPSEVEYTVDMDAINLR